MNEMEVTVYLSEGLYEYKYCVDGEWKCNPYEPTVVTKEGYINNVIQVIPPQKEQIVIVLGEKLNPDGTPSEILLGRVQALNEYIKENNVTLIILTGGAVSSKEHKSEAQTMKDYLNLIHPNLTINVQLDEQAQNTFQNALNSIELIKKTKYSGGPAVTLISSDFHIPRAYNIFLAFFQKYFTSFQLKTLSSKSPISILQQRQPMEDWLSSETNQKLSSYLNQ
uniref:DUF218 domain-containing protein n=1 Tax=Arcella intermedia TaxID=1963864 RepID=A0A6B2LEV9_9EUKA